MLFQVQNDAVVCVSIKARRLAIASLLIYLLVYIMLWLFPVAYVGQTDGIYKLIEAGNLMASLLATVLIVLLAGAFLFIKIRKQLTGARRKAIWKIIVIHIVVIVCEYLLLNILAKDARLSALSIVFQIVSVGLSRMLTTRNMVFEVVLPPNDDLMK